VEVLVYTELAMVLAARCWLQEIWDLCCSALRHETNSIEAAVPDSAVAEVLAL
jgi:hypothetical protein